MSSLFNKEDEDKLLPPEPCADQYVCGFRGWAGRVLRSLSAMFITHRLHLLSGYSRVRWVRSLGTEVTGTPRGCLLPLPQDRQQRRPFSVLQQRVV